MNAIITMAIIAAAVFVLWLLMIMPRLKKHPAEKEMRGYMYAHRGLHDTSHGAPENSSAAFTAAVAQGYGIELDLHLTRSGELAVIHDTMLTRTAGKNLDITTLEKPEIASVRLEGTNETIPMFGDVLKIVCGRVPILIELKIDGGNWRQICDATIAALDGYTGLYAIQSFDPRAVLYMRQHYPHVMRGQLAGYLRRAGENLHSLLDYGLRNLLTTFLTKPDFISYRIDDIHRLSITMCRLVYCPLVFCWTIRNESQLAACRRIGATPIFENLTPLTKDVSGEKQ